MNKTNVFVYPLMDNMYINLTNKCCCRCEFCLRNNGEGIKGNVLWLEYEPTAEQVIAEINRAKFEYNEVVFCGYGESTYRLEVMLEVAEFVKNTLNKKTRLNTNGLGDLICGEKIATKLMGLIDVVSVSLNESTGEKYDKLCHPIYGVHAFAAILDFAADCKKCGMDTRFTIVDVIGEKAVKECQEIADNLGIKLRVRKHISNNNSYT